MILMSKSFLTITKIQLSLRSWGPTGQYKSNPAFARFFFPENGFWMYTTPALRPSPASSADIVHLYPFLQFWCITNISTLVYSLGFHYHQIQASQLKNFEPIFYLPNPFLYQILGFIPFFFSQIFYSDFFYFVFFSSFFLLSCFNIYFVSWRALLDLILAVIHSVWSIPYYHLLICLFLSLLFISCT